MDIPPALTELAASLGGNALSAIAILVAGWLGVRLVSKLLREAMVRSKLDATLTSFLSNLLHYVLMGLVLLAALGNLGVETTQFIAVIGAAGLAIGLAWEGAMSNFAAGVIIIVFRPFKVGDYIEAADVEGFVEEIEMVVTTLRTLENEIIVVPNSEITGATIKNHSTAPYRLLEIPFMVAHDADLDTVIRILHEAGTGNPHVLAEPAPAVAVTDLVRDGVHLQLEIPITGGAHEDAQYSIMETVKRAFDDAAIRPPHQRLDVAWDADRAPAVRTSA